MHWSKPNSQIVVTFFGIKILLIKHPANEYDEICRIFDGIETILEFRHTNTKISYLLLVMSLFPMIIFSSSS